VRHDAELSLDQHQLRAVMHFVLFDREEHFKALFGGCLAGIETISLNALSLRASRNDAKVSAVRCSMSMICAFVRGTCSSALSFMKRPAKS
jgi:hypothetical protein